MNYYAVERSTDHLAHYGVTGMRWGVRRAITTGNQRALDRHYRKAAKKLAKLQNIGDHAYKSAAKAAGYGAAAAGAGALAIGGSKLASGAIRKANAITPLVFGKKKPFVKVDKAADAIDKLAAGKTKVPIGLKYAKNVGGRIEQAHAGEKGAYAIGLKKRYVSNDKLIRAGAGLAAIGLAAKAGQHAYRAKNSEKYREKAERFRDEMDKAFAGTDYEGSYAKMSRRQQKRRRGYY
jgi:hypothetical protein